MGVLVITPPAAAWTAQEVADWVHADMDEPRDVTNLEACIGAARDMIEQECDITLVETEFEQTLEYCFPGYDRGSGRVIENAITLLRRPLMEVSEISYFDEDGAEQVLDAASYIVDAHRERARVVPAPDYYWPTTQRRVNAATITFTAGFGDAEDVPKCYGLAARMLIEYWWGHPDMRGTTPDDLMRAVKHICGAKGSHSVV